MRQVGFSRPNLAGYIVPRFFKTINSAVGAAGLDSRGKPYIHHTAFYNYFLRPATTCDSFSDICTQLDKEKAIQNLKDIVHCLKPEIIIFLSKYVVDVVEEDRFWEFTEPLGIKYTYTNHPSMSYWNRAVREAFFKGRTVGNISNIFSIPSHKESS